MARRSLPWRTVALALVAVLSAGVIATLVWPRTQAGRALPTGPAAPCPAGFVDQVGHADLLRARLRSTDEGRQLLDALGETEVRYCFGDADVPMITDERVLVLDRDMDDAELAARTGHLLDHVVHGSPFPAEVPPGADCDALVRSALEAEARAYALELRLRRALGVGTARYAFEPEAARASDPAEVILAYLLAHPEGGPGLDALGAGYRMRCERAAHR